MNGIILAIDPGASGAIAAQGSAGWEVTPMPVTESDVVTLLRKYTNLMTDHDGRETKTAYVEQIVKHMGLGIPASTMAVYAQNHGIILGALLAFGWRIELVTPQAWQKALGLGITGRQKAPKGATAEQKKAVKLINSRLKQDWKNKLKATAQRLYPSSVATLKTADALLILRYAELRETNKLTALTPPQPTESE